MAFDLLLCCLPFPFLFVSIFGYTMVGSDRAFNLVKEAVHNLVPASQDLFLQALSHITANRTLLGFTGFILFLIFSTTVFTSARFVVNAVFMTQTSQPFFKGKIRDVLMMLGMSILLILTMIINSALTFAEAFGEQLPLVGTLIKPVWVIIGEALGFGFITTLFYLLYRFSSAKRISQGALIVGSFSGAILFEISKQVFSWYVSVAQPIATVYGALSGVIFFFVWLYLACVIFVLGAQIGYAYEQERYKVS